MKTAQRYSTSLVLSFVAATLATPAADVGKFVFVQKDVTSYKAAAPEAGVPVAVGSGIAVGDREVTGVNSGAKMLFGEGGVISLGANTSLLIKQETVDQATGKKTSWFDVIGRARIFLSRFWSDRPEVKVDTQTAVVGIKGTEVGLERFRDNRLTVTAFSGITTVDTKGARPQRFELQPGMQLKIDALGNPVGPPTAISAAELDALRQSTDPMLVIEGTVVTAGSGLAAPGGGDIAQQFSGLGSLGAAMRNTQTESLAANGPTWSDPSSAALLAPLVTDCNCTPIEPQ
jgi:hypothetical protein